MKVWTITVFHRVGLSVLGVGRRARSHSGGGGALASVVRTVCEDHGTVAVVAVEGTLEEETASEYSSMKATVRDDPAFDAVGLLGNNGGGSSTSSEDIYFQTKRPRNTPCGREWGSIALPGRISRSFPGILCKAGIHSGEYRGGGAANVGGTERRNCDDDPG